MTDVQSTSIDELMADAEAEWLDGWTSGPTEPEGAGLPSGTVAPDLVLADHTGQDRSLSAFWADRAVLLMFWRHFGCSCGMDRGKRLVDEYDAYLDAGITPVIIAQGEPARAAAYRSEQGLPCPVLCDPDHQAYRSYGIGQWPVARVLYDAPAEFWTHPRELGASFQTSRREDGQPPVDDPWRAAAEFVIGSDGVVRLAHLYQSCEDYPDARVLTTAARLG